MSTFGDYCRQLSALAWKNRILKCRYWGTLLLEIVVPTAIILALGGLSAAIPANTYDQTIPNSATQIQTFLAPLTSNSNIYYGTSLCGSYGNLLWNCANKIPCNDNSVFLNALLKCQLKRIGVAPASSTNSNATKAAQDFVAFANSQYKSVSGLNFSQIFVFFSSESAFNSYLTSAKYSLDPSIEVYGAGVIFQSTNPNWQYKLRTNMTYVGRNSQELVAPSTSSEAVDISILSSKQSPSIGQTYLNAYIENGILSLGDLVNSFTATATCRVLGECSGTQYTKIYTEGGVDFPSKKVTINAFWNAAGFIFALLMILALLYPIANVIRALVQEKETKLKEGMMMMAMRGDSHFMSWNLHFFGLFIPLSIILTFAGKLLFQYSDSQYIFFYFILFFMSATAYSFFISKLFNRSLTAAVFGCVVFFAGFFIFVGLSAGGKQADKSQILAACLHPAAAFTYGTLAFSQYEAAQVGVTSNTWNQPGKYPVSFQDTLTMQFVDFIYLYILAWYLGEIWPSEFGTHKPWYFIFLPSYYLQCFRHTFGIKRYADDRKVGDASNVPTEEVPVEAVPETLARQIDAHTCVDIRNLFKEFKTSSGTKVAVDNLNLTIFSGQITALLGHNGAGKSTVIGMLTGLITPDAGTAIVEGQDINNDLAAIRRTLGVCPQHDVLYPDLTVEEHLVLFACFKGAKGPAMRKEVSDMINAVGLTEKRNARAKTLSGGQKRKLSVGIAFIGGSRVVFLDEPTSGMDPYSRRFTWNVIRQSREGRVIVLTTHFMDEADLLGDRIAIMGDGKLKCCGSSLFLKNIYGVGYNMTLEKVDPVAFDTNGMTDLVHSHIPEAKTLTDAGRELVFQLPLSSSNKFQAFFDHLDNNEAALGIRSYGVSVTTLEEVFIRVAHGTETQSKQDNEQKKQQALVGEKQMEIGQEPPVDVEAGTIDGKYKPLNDFRKIDDEDYVAYFFRHMQAMLRKRYLYFSRDTKSWVFQYGVPLGLVLIGMIIQNVTNFLQIQPALVINTSLYNGGISTNILPTVYNNGNGFCSSTSQCSKFTGQATFANSIPSASNFPTIPASTATNFSSVSDFVFNTRNKFQASQFGAFSLYNAGFHGDVPANLTYFVHSNYSAVFGAPLFQSLMAQSVLKQMSGTATSTLTIEPLPYTNKQATQIASYNVSLIGTFILLAIPWLAASFASYVVREREMKSKHQQMVSGVSIYSYWLAQWIWDFVSYQPTLWVIVILICAFPGTDSYSSISSGALGCTIGLLILFGSSISGFSYCLSFMFKTPSGAQIIMVFVILLLGLILQIIATVLRAIPSTNSVYLSTLRPIFLLAPPFALGEGLSNLASIATWSYLELPGGELYSPGDMKITGLNLIYMGWETVVYLLFAIVYEYVSLMPFFEAVFSPTGVLPEDNTLRDEDVLAEEERVRSGHADATSAILLKDVKKIYPGGKYAVRGVSVGIPNGECFGLLGINGAGKSTTLSMLSGEFKPSYGEAFLGGLSLLTDVNKCRRKIGFCPQFDALFDLLTGREHLELYARIKGIAEEDIPKVVDAKIAEMGLTEYANRSAHTYSGGNKRKLSVAIAMIGEPSIVFLDEPSTGMDPVARRFMWQVITDIVTKRESCSLILTTHSMEECEALCTRIGIMVGGVMRCLGSAQRLRTRYGHGFQIEIGIVVPTTEQVESKANSILLNLNVPQNTATEPDVYLTRQSVEAAFDRLGVPHWKSRLSTDGSGAEVIALFPNVPARFLASWWILEASFDRITSFLQSEFGSFVLRERQLSKVRVEVSAFTNREMTHRRKLGSMFGAIEQHKAELGIQDYSIAQTSLEQIFNQFAAQQEEEKGPAAGIRSE